MIERNWIAEALGVPVRLTWSDQRFPLPQGQQMGLTELALLEVRRPGVYIIEKMSLGRSPYTVRVGSVTTGTIYSRLRAHERDRKITQHRNNGLFGSGMRAFWSWTDGLNPQGVEKYLERVLEPKEGERYPKMIEEIPVGLPQSILDSRLGIVRGPLGLPDLVY